MENVKLKDFLNYRYLHNLKLSQNKKNVCFIVSQMNINNNSYDSNIWNYNLKTGSVRQLTTDNKTEKYIWYDNETLIIPSKETGKDKTSYHRLNITNGKSEKYFTIPLSVKSITKIDNDNYLISSLYNNYYEEDNDICGKDNDDLPKAEYMKDFYMFDEIPFWHDEKGIINKIRNRLYIYNTKSQDVTPISDRYVDTYTPIVKGNKILYRAKKITKKIEITSGIYLYDMNTKNTDTIVREDMFNIAHIGFLGDHVIFIGSDMEHYGIKENMEIYIARNDEIKALNKLDKSIKNAITTDSRYKKGKTVKFDRNKLYFTITENYSTRICCINSKGNFENITELKDSFDEYVVCDDEIIFRGMRDMRLPELYSFKNKKTTILTSFNESIKSNKNVVTPETFSFKSNGYDLTGFVLKPVNFKLHKKYPAILYIHGGPNSTYGEIFYHEMQCLVNSGYFIFYSNPHGSAGYGNEFADLRGKYGSVDYEDLMNFTDEVFKRYKNINTERVGVIGGSYGGFMANWIIGHTDRFKCAVSDKGIANWLCKFATTDIGITTNVDQQAATPWTNYKRMWNHSPMKYAHKVKTPTLFIHSENDYRCWYSEGIQMYTSLMFNNVESKLYIFKNENHGLNRTGRPINKIKRLEIIFEWFDKHLK